MRHHRLVRALLRPTACIVVAAVALSTMAAAPRAGVVKTPSRVPVEVDLARVAQPDSGLPAGSGVLRNEKKAGTAGIVAAVLWPSTEMNRQLHVGSSVPTLTVGWTRTDADGSYLVRIDPAMVPPSYIEADGRINLDLVGWTDTQVGRLGFPFDLGAAKWNAANPRATRAAGKPVHVELTADRPNVAFRTPEGPRLVRDASVGTGGITPMWSSCTWNVMSTFNANTSIGRTWSYGSDTGWMLSGSSQSMTLGYAVSTTGKIGDWSASGTSTSTTGVTFEWSESTSWREFFVSQHFGRYRLMDCSGNWQNNWYSKAMYDNGTYTTAGAGTKPSFPTCLANSAGLWQRSNSDGYSYKLSFGARTITSLGINLSSESNYSSNHILKYRLKATGKVCGTNAVPAKASEVATNR